MLLSYGDLKFLANYMLSLVRLSSACNARQAGIWTSSNTWFLEPTQAHNPNSSSIGSVILQGSLMWQTDKQTMPLSR